MDHHRALPIRKTYFLIIWILTIQTIPAAAQTKLPFPVNDEKAVEYAPSISADGNTLIFQSNRDGKFKLYLATKDSNGIWSNPKSLDKINEYGADHDLIGGPTISYDGNTLYYFATFKEGMGNEDIFYSVREGDDFSEPINMGRAINTRGYEGFPSISSDGKKLYFMKPARYQRIRGVFCYSIWVAERNETGKWQRPRMLPEPVNRACEKIPRIMSDNEMLVFASIRDGGKSDHTFDLYYSRLDEKGNWGEVRPFEYLNTIEDELVATASACGKQLYYVRTDRKADTSAIADPGFKNLNIYAIEMTDESRPKEVALVQGQLLDERTGAPLFGDISIVQEENQRTQGMLLTNKVSGLFTLIMTRGYTYKVSFRVPGYLPRVITYKSDEFPGCTTQKRDVLMNSREGTYTLSTFNSLDRQPLDVGLDIRAASGDTPVDPERMERGRYSVTVYHNERYTISIGGKGITDTTYTFEPKIKTPDARDFDEKIIVQVEKPRVELHILNKATGKPVDKAWLTITDKKTGRAVYNQIPDQHSYTFDAMPTDMFEVIVKADHHFTYRAEINVAEEGPFGTISHTAEMIELKPGARLVARNIHFATNSAQLTAESYQAIDRVIAVLKEEPHLKLEISAHTDDVGSHESNITLSNARARSVLDYMVLKQISSGRLIAKGYGEEEPLVPNTSEKNRALNRRVEFRIPDH